MASSTIAPRAGAAGTILGGSPLSFSDFEPHHGQVGTQVTIYGTGLNSVTLVQFNGYDAKLGPSTDAQLVVTVPDRAPSGPITISDGTTRITSRDSFTVDPPVSVVDSVSPVAGSPGTTLTFTGKHLANVSAVRFNAVNGPFDAVPMALMPKSFKAVVPSGAAAGPARIVVTTPLNTTAIGFKIKR
ncbi:MAG TPA: IPT/TIG domain-containing protein [Candidatus Elarobacter sp.]